MTCPVCRRPSDDGDHGQCLLRMAREIARLQELLIDSGIMRKGAL